MTDGPLNSFLHDRLKRLCGEVRISAAGEALVATREVDPLTGRQRWQVLSAGEYYCVPCFWCNDTRFRLWINHRFGTLDPDGRPMLFLAHCYNDDCLADPQVRQNLYQRIYGLANRNAREQVRILPGRRPDLGPPPPATLPGECIPVEQLPANHPALLYMYQRNYPLDLLQHHGVHFCVAAPRYPMAQGRLIIPIYHDGRLVGWQGRYPADPDWKTVGMPKYYTMPGMKRSAILYNLDRAKAEPFVVVVEGPTSAWRVGDCAVALLGGSISAHQQQLLMMHWAGKPIIFLLEAEKADEMLRTVNAMRRSNSSPILTYTFPKGKDPGNSTPAELLAIVEGIAAAARVTLAF